MKEGEILTFSLVSLKFFSEAKHPTSFGFIPGDSRYFKGCYKILESNQGCQ